MLLMAIGMRAVGVISAVYRRRFVLGPARLRARTRSQRVVMEIGAQACASLWSPQAAAPGSLPPTLRI